MPLKSSLSLHFYNVIRDCQIVIKLEIHLQFPSGFETAEKGIRRILSNSSSSSMALQPGMGLSLLYNTPLSLSIPCSVSPFIYSHLPQVRGHVIQPSHLWSSSSSCCIQLSVQYHFRNCGVLHSFYMTKPSYSLAFYKPDNVLPLNYSF